MYAILRVQSDKLENHYAYTCVKVLNTDFLKEAMEFAETYMLDNPYLIGKGKVVAAKIELSISGKIDNVHLTKETFKTELPVETPKFEKMPYKVLDETATRRLDA